MELRSIIVLFMVLYILNTSSGQYESLQQSFRPSHIRKYCGKHLSAALSTICHGNYNTMQKKASSSSDGSQKKNFPRKQKRDLTSPFIDKEEAATMMTNFRRRRRRGVFNECCEKPCTHDELSTYCAAPQSSTNRRR